MHFGHNVDFEISLYDVKKRIDSWEYSELSGAH